MSRTHGTILQILLFAFTIYCYLCLPVVQDNMISLSSVEKNLSRAKNGSRCIFYHCEIDCFAGKIADIHNDIAEAEIIAHCFLHRYTLQITDYEFPDKTIPRNIFGKLPITVDVLLITRSKIKAVESGAFANTHFHTLQLTDLELCALTKGFFDGISPAFRSLRIYQTSKPLQTLENNFLESVSDQIEKLTLQVGISCIHNLTSGNSALLSLKKVDFSYNNLSKPFDSLSFYQLAVVEELNLSHSQISYLPDNIFANFVGTLKNLDLSNNNLLTISHEIFGNNPLPMSLKINLRNNKWECSCTLYQELQILQTRIYSSDTCREPDYHQNWWVMDKRLCSSDNKSDDYNDVRNLTEKNSVALYCSEYNINIKNSPPYAVFTERPLYQLDIYSYAELLVELRTYANNFKNFYGILWVPQYALDISWYRSAWEYIPVSQLASSGKHTLCAVPRYRRTVSPFSCKSVYLDDNTSRARNMWLSKDMRLTVITSVTFCALLFLCVGVVSVYILFRYKPTILRGNISRGVRNKNASRKGMKTIARREKIQYFRQRQTTTANTSPRNASHNRQNSFVSSVSDGSYINASPYETIAEYLYLIREPSQSDASHTKNLSMEEQISQNPSHSDLLLPGFIKLPTHKKRFANDPLPAIPEGQNRF